MSEDERLYGVAASIADQLLARGVPVAGFGGLRGRISMRFALANAPATYICQCDEAKASPEYFERLYRAVA